MDKIWFVDDTPSTRFPLYTRGNIGEVFPVVVSPLTWTLYGGEAEMGWRDAWKKFGVYLDRDLGTEPMGIIGCFGGYGYLNASYIRVFAVLGYGNPRRINAHGYVRLNGACNRIDD